MLSRLFAALALLTAGGEASSALAGSPRIQTAILESGSFGEHEEVGRVLLCIDTKGRFIPSESACLAALPEDAELVPLSGESHRARLVRNEEGGLGLSWTLPEGDDSHPTLVYVRSGTTAPSDVEAAACFDLDEEHEDPEEERLLYERTQNLSFDTRALLDFDMIKATPKLEKKIDKGALVVVMELSTRSGLHAKLDGDDAPDLLLSGFVHIVSSAHIATLQAQAETEGDEVDPDDIYAGAEHSLQFLGVVSGSARELTPVGLYWESPGFSKLPRKSRAVKATERDMSGDDVTVGLEFEGGAISTSLTSDLVFLGGWNGWRWPTCYDINGDGQVEVDVFIGGDMQHTNVVLGFDHKGRFGPLSTAGFFGP